MSDSYLDPALYGDYPPGITPPSGTPVPTPPLPGNFIGAYSGQGAVKYLTGGGGTSAPLPPFGGGATVPTTPSDPFKGPHEGPEARREIGGMYFSVVVDGHELGDWFRVDGLSVKFEIADYRAGDARNHRWIEPSYTTYANVKLSRMTTLRYTQRILEWMQETAFTSKKVTAVITGYPHWHGSYEQTYVVKWNLRGVLPVSWTGPQFDATSGKPATESLELVHEGFLENDT